MSRTDLYDTAACDKRWCLKTPHVAVDLNGEEKKYFFVQHA